MSLINLAIRFLERPQLAKWQILAMVFVCCGLGRTRLKYEQTYGDSKQKSRAKVATQFGKLDWSEFPKQPKYFTIFRAFFVIYMIYIVIKFTLSKQIERLLKLFIDLKMPINCYLMGRYILHESSAELTAAVFSGFFSAWHILTSFVKPYRMNLVYFLWLSDHDRELVYSRLESNSGLTLESGSVETIFTPYERFLLDTLCFRVVYPKRIVFKLRANRSREAHYKLRQFVALLTISFFVVFTPVTIVLWATHSIMHLLDERYLSVYPNCDPQLESLHREGKLPKWSMTLTPHHQLAVVMDQIENLVVWIESGLMMTIAAAAFFALCYDLYLQWVDIDKKISRIFETVSNRKSWPLNDRPNQSGQGPNYELIAEMKDFFDQIAQAGGFMQQFLNAGLLGVLSICGIQAIMLTTNSIGRLALPVIAIMVGSAFYLLLGAYGILSVHWRCRHSYSTYCTIMAHRRFDYHTNFGGIIECYAQNRDCLLLFNQFRFLPTTFLTLIGWSFSCFCVITEVVERRSKWAGT